MEPSVTDQTALSFASKTAPADGVAVVFAEEGPRLSAAAEDLDKKSKGLLAKAIGITGFKGKKEQTVDLIAPQGLKFARRRGRRGWISPAVTSLRTGSISAGR